MNTESDKWAVYCMDARKQWYVMTSEGWQREDSEHLDGELEIHGKLEASERIKSTLSNVGWVFGVRMETVSQN